MIRILFLIRSLVQHGAERQLTELVKGLDKTRFSVTVVTFYDGGALRGEIEGIEGVRVLSLHKKSRWDLLAFLRLIPVMREVRPHIVHGYMGIANELCLLAGKVFGAKVVWGLRRSNSPFDLDRRRRTWTDVWIEPLTARLSRFADLIIANSQAGKQYHISNGYHAARMMVIPNGVDTGRFRPDRPAGQGMRREWGIGPNEKLIGLVGRFDAQKDHPTFLRAAALLSRTREDVRFVCVGDGPADIAAQLQGLAGELGLEGRLVWAGAVSTMPAAYNALDILVSASAYGEGSSNVIGEAMACGVPCVVTDVGDSAIIVGDRARVVPVSDPEALAAACLRVLDLSPDQMAGLREASRARIACAYSVRHLVSTTESTLRRLVPDHV